MEVSGRKISTEKSVDTEICKPCGDESKDVTADGFCRECMEYMCRSCFGHHRKHKLARDHLFLDITDELKTRVFQTEKQKGFKKCQSHCSELIKFYCREHDEVGCSDCMVLGHKMCKVEYIPEIANDFQDSLEFKALINDANWCQRDIDRRDLLCSQYRQDIEEVHERFISDIRMFKEKISKRLDTLENCMLENASVIKSRYIEDLANVANSSEETRKRVSLLHQTFESLMDEPNKLFVEAIQLKVELNSIKNQLYQDSELHKNQSYIFKHNKKLDKLINDPEALGTLSETSETVALTGHPSQRKTTRRCNDAFGKKTKSKKNTDYHDRSNEKCGEVSASDACFTVAHSRAEDPQKRNTQARNKSASKKEVSFPGLNDLVEHLQALKDEIRHRRCAESLQRPVNIAHGRSTDENISPSRKITDPSNTGSIHAVKTETPLSVALYSDIPDGYSEDKLLKTFQIRGVNVTLYYGNLVEEETDAIVNAANEQLEHYGGIAYTILKARGRAMDEECRSYVRKHGKLKTSGVMHTSGGGEIKSTFIIHAAGPMWLSERWNARFIYQLTETFLNCLNYAYAHLRIKSIALPALSAGVYGAPLDICVECFLNAVLMFTCKQHAEHRLADVRLVLNDAEQTATSITLVQSLLDHGLESLTKTVLTMMRTYEHF